MRRLVAGGAGCLELSGLPMTSNGRPASGMRPTNNRPNICARARDARRMHAAVSCGSLRACGIPALHVGLLRRRGSSGHNRLACAARVSGSADAGCASAAISPWHTPGRDVAIPCGLVGPASVTQRSASSEHLPPSSEHSKTNSEHFEPGSEQSEERTRLARRDPHGRLLPGKLDAPRIDALDQLAPEWRDQLTARAEPAGLRKTLRLADMRQVIRAMCRDQFVSLAVLAELVHRSPDALQQQHLKPMQQAALLVLAFPTSPTHPRQAYRTGKETP
jgi:hypothetical protein